MSNSNIAIVHPKTIRIAVPCAEGGFCEHFGGAEEFMICEANRETDGIERSRSYPAPEHKPGALPLWLAERGINAVVASSISERAMKIFAAKGIDVFLSDETSDPSNLARKCLA